MTDLDRKTNQLLQISTGSSTMYTESVSSNYEVTYRRPTDWIFVKN